MGRKANHLDIHEDEATLKKRLSKCTKLQEEKKVRMLIHFKGREAPDQPSLIKELNICERTLQRWKKEYAADGLDSFLSPQTRNKPSRLISESLHKALREKTNDPHDPFLGYWHAVEWVEQEHGVALKYEHLRSYLIKHFGTKVKRGRRSHIKKDADAEKAFLKSSP